MRLGFLTHLHIGEDAADSYRLALDLFAIAEELGYDSGWVAQHHFLNNGARLPSTLAFLAAAAERTRRIHLGTAIVILPLEDPLRVAEDAAVVDTLSGGRLQLGLGTGGDPLTFAAFGQDLQARRQRYPTASASSETPWPAPDQRHRGRPLPARAHPDRAPLGVHPQPRGRRADRPERQRPAARPDRVPEQ